MKTTITALLLVLGAELHAASGTGAVRGRVSSAERPVAAARVEASCYGSASVIATVTSEDGSYWLPTLTPGTCELTFAHEGLQTVTQHAEVRAADETRVDVTLETSAEGESVTSTSARSPLLERAQVVWSIERESFELLPLRRSASALLDLAPGEAFAAAGGEGSVEGVHRRGGLRLGVLDAAGRLDVLTSGTDPVLALHGGRLAMLTAPAHGTLDLGARLTGEHLRGGTKGSAEFTAGGIVRERLHLFAAARAGRLFEGSEEAEWIGVADLAARPSTSLRAALLGAGGSSEWSLRGTQVIGGRLTLDAAASEGDRRVLHGRLARMFETGAGVHELRAGVERVDPRNETALFLDDHWAISERWAVDAGARFSDGDVRPRVGVTVEPFAGSGQRLAASFGEFDDEEERSVRELAVSFGQQFDGGTSIVGTLLRRERSGGRSTEGVMIDASYRYLIFSFGGNATVVKRSGDLTQAATVWVIADAPLLEHDVNLALMQRVREDFYATDLAVTYAWSVGRLTPSAKLEVENLFGATPSAEDGTQRPRAIRLGLGVRFGLD